MALGATRARAIPARAQWNSWHKHGARSRSKLAADCGLWLVRVHIIYRSTSICPIGQLQEPSLRITEINIGGLQSTTPQVGWQMVVRSDAIAEAITRAPSRLRIQHRQVEMPEPHFALRHRVESCRLQVQIKIRKIMMSLTHCDVSSLFFCLKTLAYVWRTQYT